MVSGWEEAYRAQIPDLHELSLANGRRPIIFYLGISEEQSIASIHSSVKRCRILKDICRLLVSGIRDMVVEIGCALHNFRLRLNPWLPIPQSE
jgi:hypothetical protein